MVSLQCCTRRSRMRGITAAVTASRSGGGAGVSREDPWRWQNPDS